MKSFIFVLFLYPSLFTTVAVFFVDPNFSPIILLIFLVYTKCVSGEDIGRIEHKVDSVFKILIKDPEVEKDYDNIHKSAWDHDYPISIDENAVADSKLRHNLLLAVDVINKLIFFVLSAYWIFITLTA